MRCFGQNCVDSVTPREGTFSSSIALQTAISKNFPDLQRSSSPQGRHHCRGSDTSLTRREAGNRDDSDRDGQRFRSVDIGTCRQPCPSGRQHNRNLKYRRWWGGEATGAPAHTASQRRSSGRAMNPANSVFQQQLIKEATLATATLRVQRTGRCPSPGGTGSRIRRDKQISSGCASGPNGPILWLTRQANC